MILQQSLPQWIFSNSFEMMWNSSLNHFVQPRLVEAKSTTSSPLPLTIFRETSVALVSHQANHLLLMFCLLALHQQLKKNYFFVRKNQSFLPKIDSNNSSSSSSMFIQDSLQDVPHTYNLRCVLCNTKKGKKSGFRHVPLSTGGSKDGGWYGSEGESSLRWSCFPRSNFFPGPSWKCGASW